MKLLSFIIISALNLSAISPLEFSLTDVNGRLHTQAEIKNAKAAVFFFIATECPISNRYAPEINRVVADYTAKNLVFYAVQSDPDLTVADARAHTQGYGYKLPVLFDPSQQLASKFGVTLTPTVVVVSPAGTMFYRGRIDNRYLDLGKYRNAGIKPDLRLALDALDAGRPVSEPVTKTIGCALPLPRKE